MFPSILVMIINFSLQGALPCRTNHELVGWLGGLVMRQGQKDQPHGKPKPSIGRPPGDGKAPSTGMDEKGKPKPAKQVEKPEGSRPIVQGKKPKEKLDPARKGGKQKDIDDDDEDLEGKSDEEVLKNLEKEVEAAPQKGKKREPSGRLMRFFQSLNPDISAIGTILFGYFYDQVLKGKGNPVPRGGHDLGKSGVHLQEVELALQAEVDPFFRLDVFLSFAQFGVELEEAYFTSLALPYKLQLRVGQLYHRFGRHNQQHLHVFDFVDNMIPVVRLLGGDNMRSLTAELSWLAPLPWYVNITFALSQPNEDLTPSFVGKAREDGFHIKDPRHLLYVARIEQFFALSENWGLTFGVSYATGPNNSGGYSLNRTQLGGVDLFLKWRPLRRPYLEMKLVAEGYMRYMQVPNNKLKDFGAYAQMIWRLDKRWWLGFRYDMVEIEDLASLVTWGFEEEVVDLEHPRPIDDQHRASAALTYRPTEFSQFRLQYNLNHVRRTETDGGSGPFKAVHEVFLQVMGNIGVHGAHSY